ncbi:hypothetical protein K439DRAFT_1626727 [Ramaria rubella]|nr:hypothetical protein K439DRAFT_1626727 [Ramaria rubella]
MNVTNTPIGPGVNEYTLEYRDLYIQYFGVASFVILLYDHALTFDDEVQYIWRRNKKLVAWLFLINRYVTPLGFSININAYTSPVWTPSVNFLVIICKRFVRYEGCMTLLGISIASLMMGVRVTAIYHGNRFIPFLMSVLFTAMVGVNVWLLTGGEPVQHYAGIHGCSMIFSPRVGVWASASAWSPLIYDTVVMGLVLYRTAHLFRAKIVGQLSVVKTLMEDGIIYYSVILAANLVLAVMIVRSNDGLRNICAQMQVTMMSRITINLRKKMQRDESDLPEFDTDTTSHRSSSRPSTRHPLQDPEATVLDISRSSVRESAVGDI